LTHKNTYHTEPLTEIWWQGLISKLTQISKERRVMAKELRCKNDHVFKVSKAKIADGPTKYLLCPECGEGTELEDELTDIGVFNNQE
jgi:hypothetical protein